MDAMETTTTKTTQAGQAGLIPGEGITDNLDNVLVNEPINDRNIEAIEPIISLGEDKGAKILLDVEDGIKTFLKDGLAAKNNQTLEKYGLANDMDRVKALPPKMTGVLIYYLTKGIERDFGITWEKTPVSLQDKAKNQSNIVKARKEGKRGLSKQKKNDIMEKQDMKYWRPFIEDGSITKEQAYEEIDKQYAEQKKWEAEGFYFSPKKTEGLLLFDYKKEVTRTNGRENGYKIYSRNDLSVVIPNVVENYCLDEDAKGNKKLKREYEKTWLKEPDDIKSIDDVLGDDWGKMNSSRNEVLENKVNGLHIVKIMKSGFMKDRWLCFDCDDKKTGKQVLHLFCGAQHMTMYEDELKDR